MSGPIITPFVYRAKILRVIDGDTIIAVVDLGFSIASEQTFRLARINAPEMRGDTHDAGIAARDFLINTVANNTVIMQTSKDRKEKYGRYLAEVFIGDGNVSDLMVSSGHAIYKEY